MVLSAADRPDDKPRMLMREGDCNVITLEAFWAPSEARRSEGKSPRTKTRQSVFFRNPPESKKTANASVADFGDNGGTSSTSKLSWRGAHRTPIHDMMSNMTTRMAVDPTLDRFRSALRKLYGPALDRVVLFGSRARGDSTPDSDYDVAVFLKGVDDLMSEFKKLADLRVQFLDRDDAFFDAIPFRASAYGERTPIMHEIRRDGVNL